MLTLTADEARLAALWAQGFVDPIEGVTPSAAQRMGSDRRSRLVHAMLTHLGAVQLDTISVLARSHELIAYARFGAIGRDVVEDAYWQRSLSFEYWSHAACILPVESWPMFSGRRRYFAERGIRWHDVPQSAIGPVLDRLADGPISTADIGGAKKGGQWWDWSDSKIAIEWLLDVGTVVCSRREGWRRVYDLAERVVPGDLLAQLWDDEQCLVEMVRTGAQTLGVGTAADIADVHRVKTADARRLAEPAGLVPVRVEGWKDAAWASPDAVAWLDAQPRVRHRTTLVSPFDSLVWHRPRAERIFGMSHRLEAYTPAHKRVHGYFAMPVLHQGRLVARVDPKRERDGLHARRVTMESTSRVAVEGTARALREAATWAPTSPGVAGHVVLGEVVPSSAKPALAAALRADG